MPNTYRVTISEHVYGSVTIQAASADEAMDIAQATLDADGVAGFDDFTPGDRDCDVIDAEEEGE